MNHAITLHLCLQCDQDAILEVIHWVGVKYPNIIVQMCLSWPNFSMDLDNSK